MKYITLAIDEKTADFITGLMNSVPVDEMAKMAITLGVVPEAKRFFEEFTNSTHEMGWCKDPECERK